MSTLANTEQKALAWGIENYPNSPEIHHRVFASVVQFACNTNISRYKIIRTMRTFVAINKIFLFNSPGQLTFDEAIKLIEHECYGPITLEHAQIYRQCKYHDDDLDDIQKAKKIIAELSSTFIPNAERSK